MIKKVSFIITLLLIFITISNITCYAFSDVLDNPTEYEPGTSSSSKTEGVITKLLSMITNVGIVLSVIMLAVIGLKYLMGSIEEKAEYKQSLVPYIIGIFLLLGITTITKIILEIGEKISNI